MKRRLLLAALSATAVGLAWLGFSPAGASNAAGITVNIGATEYSTHNSIPCDGTAHNLTDGPNWPVILASATATTPGDAPVSAFVPGYISQVKTGNAQAALSGTAVQTLYMGWTDPPDAGGETYVFKSVVGAGAEQVTATCTINISP